MYMIATYAPKLCLFSPSTSPNFRRSLKSLRLLSRRCCSSFRTPVASRSCCVAVAPQVLQAMIPMTHQISSV